MILAAPSAMRVWVVYQCRRSYDFDLGYWNDELGAAFAQALFFFENEVPVIPREQEDVVGRLGRKDFRRDDRNMATGSEEPNLIWRRIGDVFQIIGGKTAEVEQCITFGGGTVCRNHLPFGTKTPHQRDELVANDFYFFLETAESF